MSLIRVATLACASAFCVSSAVAQPSATPAAQTIDVHNFAFNPKPIHLEAGRPVTLTFVNSANGGHDFTAREFFAASTISAGDAREGEVELKAHETKSVTLTPRAGTYHAHCSHFMHAAMGMTDTIVVN